MRRQEPKVTSCSSSRASTHAFILRQVGSVARQLRMPSWRCGSRSTTLTRRKKNRAIIAGSGYGELDGGCDAGAKALETATNQAIKTAMQNYVSRVINGDEI